MPGTSTADPEAIVAGFAPASIAELERRAALQVRMDQKYIVGLDALGQLMTALASDHLALEIAGRRLFRYDTVYFDTAKLHTYAAHHQGRRRRFKCRTRLYADTDTCFIELKVQGGRGQTDKRKRPLDPADHGSLTAEARAFLDAELRAAYGHPAPPELVPVLRTVYRRLTLVRATSAERLTCDFGLTFTVDSRGRWGIRPGRVLVETKTPRGNGAADRALRKLGVRPVDACSKYCVGVALAHPDVRDNRFRRVMERDFRSSAPALIDRLSWPIQRDLEAAVSVPPVRS
jgi:hypothetical protein